MLEEKISDKQLMDKDKLVKGLMTTRIPRPHKREILDPARTSYLNNHSEYYAEFIDFCYCLIPLHFRATGSHRLRVLSGCGKSDFNTCACLVILLLSRMILTCYSSILNCIRR